LTALVELEEVRGWVRAAGRVTALTGAGISTDSGIPDYRGPNGVWTRDPRAERLSTYDDYVSDPEIRRESWRKRLEHTAWTASPNAGHTALRDFAGTGRLRALITQNVDGLHQRAGSADGDVIELHGTIWFSECVQCRDRRPMDELLDRVRAGDDDPACEVCGGIIKSATISFGQSLDPQVIERAVAAAADCDVFIAIGTSLTVQPAAGLCEVAVRAGARLVIVNAQPTPYDDLADAVLRDSISDVLPRLLDG
jgi:NAD-dependent deacetylase